MPVTNSKNVADDATHCNGTSKFHLSRMPFLHAMAESFDEKETEDRGMHIAHFIEILAPLIKFSVFHMSPAVKLAPFARVVP